MKIKYIYLSLFVAVLGACESIVDVKVNEQEPYLVVDAWLTRGSEDQTVRLTTTQPYYETEFADGVREAQVKITDGSGNTFDFLDQGNGDYTYSPTDTFGVVNETYFLEIVWNNHIYTSQSTLPRSVAIDSITYTYEEGDGFSSEYYYSEFHGRDPEGVGDAYWLKAWKNGTYLNKPSEIYLFFDASFSEGNGDNIPFIFPIRVLANSFEVDINNNVIPPYFLADTFTIGATSNTFELYDSEVLLKDETLEVQLDEGRDDPEGGGVESYPLDGAPFYQLNDSTIVKKADSIFLELHAISPDAWFFLTRLQQETNRPEGFGALFATPPSNIPTNIVADDSETPVAGFFNLSNVSRLGRKLTQDAILER